MCLHVLFSFQRTRLRSPSRAAARLAPPSCCSPRLVGVPKTGVSTVFRGTFLHYYSHLWLSTRFPAATRSRQWRQKLTPGRLLKTLPYVVSDLGARRPGSLGTNAESEPRYYAPEVGLSTRRSPLLESHFTALSGGTGPRRASRNRCLPCGRSAGHAHLKSTRPCAVMSTRLAVAGGRQVAPA
jgi:hypothetical protein